MTDGYVVVDIVGAVAILTLLVSLVRITMRAAEFTRTVEKQIDATTTKIRIDLAIITRDVGQLQKDVARMWDLWDGGKHER